MKHYSFYLFLIFCSIRCQHKKLTLEESIQKSIDWIWHMQSADGGWHSETHNVLQDGKVLTPYILYQLSQVQNGFDDTRNNQIEKGINFIIHSMSASLNADSTALIEYPNYSAAYALRLLHTMKRDTVLQNMIAEYLMKQQFTEHRGFTKDSLAYGGWGYGEPDLKKGDHGHEDMSHTRRVVQALVETGYFEAKGKETVIQFLLGTQRVQSDNRPYEGCVSRQHLPYDGGFVSSVVTLETNKSQPVIIEGAGYHYPSYATATCDGLIAMHALGMDTTKMFDDAKEWLLKHHNYSFIDGLLKIDPEQWTHIMHFYHLSVRAEAMAIIEPGGSWSDSISALIIKEQLPEGNYMNPLGGVNKEDDPLVSTIFCIQAGEKCRNVGGQEK